MVVQRVHVAGPLLSAGCDSFAIPTENRQALHAAGLAIHSRPGKLVGSRPVSRVLSRTIIHLRPTSPWAFSNQPENQRGPRRCSPIWSCSGWGLPCHSCYHQRGALLPHHFTLTRLHGRYIFCGTFRRLAPPRCYLAPCPMEPGLSSPADHMGKPAR